MTITPAQRRALLARARGATMADAAHRLHLSEQTVKNESRDAYAALDVTNVVAAYVVLGWLRPPDGVMQPSRIVRERLS
jgi:DNA-binding NarL/FixJ family response regulator